MNYHNLTHDTTERLMEEKFYLELTLSGNNPFCKLSSTKKGAAKWKLGQIKFELRKKYRKGQSVSYE